MRPEWPGARGFTVLDKAGETGEEELDSASVARAMNMTLSQDFSSSFVCWYTTMVDRAILVTILTFSCVTGKVPVGDRELGAAHGALDRRPLQVAFRNRRGQWHSTSRCRRYHVYAVEVEISTRLLVVLA